MSGIFAKTELEMQGKKIKNKLYNKITILYLNFYIPLGGGKIYE